MPLKPLIDFPNAPYPPQHHRYPPPVAVVGWLLGRDADAGVRVPIASPAAYQVSVVDGNLGTHYLGEHVHPSWHNWHWLSTHF